MSLSQVEDGPTVNCLRCGISVAMTSMGKHIADVHESSEGTPFARASEMPHFSCYQFLMIAGFFCMY